MYFSRADITEFKFEDDWTEVIFYYDKNESEKESACLFNVNDWPIIHKDMQHKFEEIGVKGIQYLPVKLKELCTGEVNHNYVFMNVLNYIEAINLEKSEYRYDKKYNLYNSFPGDEVLDFMIMLWILFYKNFTYALHTYIINMKNKMDRWR